MEIRSFLSRKKSPVPSPQAPLTSRAVAIVSSKQNEELQKQGKLLAGSRVKIAQVGFTVFIKKGAAKHDLSSADALKRALLAAKSIAVGDPARGGGASLYTVGLLKRLGIGGSKGEKPTGSVRH